MARKASAMRGSILESAVRLFADRGYEATSLHDIASAAECSKASLLYHFTSKDAILTELLGPAGAALADLDSRLAGLTGEAAVVDAVTGYVALTLRFRRETKILIDDPSVLDRIPELSGIPRLAKRVQNVMAGRSDDPARAVAAHMVLRSVPHTSKHFADMADEDLQAHLTGAALRALSPTHLRDRWRGTGACGSGRARVPRSPIQSDPNERP